MKILFYTNSFYPDPIGIAYYNAEWVEALHALGHEVEILTAVPYYPQWHVASAYAGRWQVVETYKGMRVTRTWLFVPRRQTALNRFLCEASFMVRSLWTLWGTQADFVIAVSPPFGVELAAAKHRWWRGASLWLHVQDLQVDAGAAVGFLSQGLLVRGLKRLERWCWDQADVLTTISESMKARMSVSATLGRTIDLFPNWVDGDTMRPTPSPTKFRQQCGLHDEFLVLYAGSLGIHQGLDDLLETAQLLKDDASIRFVVVGEGHYRATFTEHIAALKLTNVQWLPLQPKEALPDMLSSADVGLVLETRAMANLSMPSKILNQMACGRPLLVVADPQSLLAQTVERLQTGVVVPPHQPGVLADQVRRLKTDRSSLARWGENARRFVLATHDRKTIFEKMPAMLQRATAKETRYREYVLKRPLDIFLVGVGFLITSPLWLLIPIFIKAEDGGPVFYSQVRTGRYGRPFRAYKFRSMRVSQAGTYVQAQRDDPRISKVGRWLRRTAADELPQLWNIARGDISFVGPRALLPSEREVSGKGMEDIPLEQIPGYAQRVVMRPGLTGITQILAPRDLPRRLKFRYDALYLKRAGFFLDVRIILKSIWTSVFARWGKVNRHA